LPTATCYGFVKQSGGHIEVESEISKGATFTVYLPKTDALADTTEDKDTVPPSVKGTETVLLAEDEPLILTMVSRTLRDQGYRVLESTNGEEALRVAQEHASERIDVLVTDIVMPRMGGLELAERIRSVRGGLKIVFTSGYTDKTVFNKGEQEPGVAFLPKPFLPEELAIKVRSVLD